MVSSKLLDLENSIDNLSPEEKRWLLDKIVQQMGKIAEDANPTQEPPNIKYNNEVKPIWEIAVEMGAKIPESQWEKVPRDLSKNFDLYQGSGE